MGITEWGPLARALAGMGREGFLQGMNKTILKDKMDLGGQRLQVHVRASTMAQRREAAWWMEELKELLVSRRPSSHWEVRCQRKRCW